MEEQNNKEDVKLYIEKIEDAKTIAKNQESKGTTLSMDNIVAMATTMFIGVQQKQLRGRA